jgi:hypothetical protein
MKLFKWTNGRQQECKYKKLCFFFAKFKKIGFDGYILKYEPYAILPTHIDQVKKGEHYRLNIVLSNGPFSTYCQKNIFSFFNQRIVLFRPDLYQHGMVNGYKQRIVLSLGLAIF